jgi:DNA-binding IclR family transcriptional regulator
MDERRPLPADGPIARERGIDRVLRLLDCLHQRGQPIRIGDLARAMNAPRSSTYEIVRTLVDAALLEIGADGRIFFGKSLYFYGADYLREHDLVRRGRDEVDRLARETGETSQFCMLHENKYTVVHMRAGARPFGISSDIGTQVPLPWTASGRLLLSHLQPQEIKAIVRPEDLRLPNGEAIEIEAFVAAVADARQKGFCMTSGLVDAYTHCVAAPVLDPDGHAVATLCFVVPVDTAPARLSELREILIESGHSLSLVSSRSPATGSWNG